MSALKEQPTIEELLKTPDGAMALARIWSEKAGKETDAKEKQLWEKAASDARKTANILAGNAQLKRFARPAREAKRSLTKARNSAQAGGADEEVLSVFDVAGLALDCIIPQKK